MKPIQPRIGPGYILTFWSDPATTTKVAVRAEKKGKKGPYPKTYDVADLVVSRTSTEVNGPVAEFNADLTTRTKQLKAGKEHTFEFEVALVDQSGKIGEYIPASVEVVPPKRAMAVLKWVGLSLAIIFAVFMTVKSIMSQKADHTKSNVVTTSPTPIAKAKGVAKEDPSAPKPTTMGSVVQQGTMQTREDALVANPPSIHNSGITNSIEVIGDNNDTTVNLGVINNTIVHYHSKDGEMRTQRSGDEKEQSVSSIGLEWMHDGKIPIKKTSLNIKCPEDDTVTERVIPETIPPGAYNEYSCPPDWRVVISYPKPTTHKVRWAYLVDKGPDGKSPGWIPADDYNERIHGHGMYLRVKNGDKPLPLIFTLTPDPIR